MKAYIFDLDGTLFDSMGVWDEIDIAFLKKRGLDGPQNYVDKMSECGFEEGAAYTIKRFGLSERPEDLMAEWHAMAMDAYTHTVRLKPHALEYLLQLKACGAKMGIATSLPPELHIPALKANGIDQLFDALSHSDEVGCGKTKPDVFLLAAERLGTAPKDCIVFDDVMAAIVSAKGAGMTAYALYDASSAHLWDEIKQVSDGAFMDFSEVPLPDCEHQSNAQDSNRS